MSKLTRVFQNLFCGSASSGNVGQFGSLQIGTPTTTLNIATIQALSAWMQGFTLETVAGNTPALEDFNGIFLVAFYQICYILQMGIPEYDPSTTYYTNSIVQYGGTLYQSLVDSNTGNTPSSSPSQWGGNVSGNPSGTVIIIAMASPPTGYLLCNGQAVSRTTYSTLFGLLGTTYGSGDGTTTFNVPNMQGNAPVGYKSGDANFGTLGGNPGEANHTLSINEMPGHTHPYGVANSSQSGTPSGAASNGGGDFTSQSTGGGQPHNNVQPSLVMNFCIKT